MSGCTHEDFEAHVAVNRLCDADTDGPHSFAADIHVKCAECGRPFGFRAQDVGLLPDRPAVSPDALELRVPLIPPSELDLLGPLAAMRRPTIDCRYTLLEARGMGWLPPGSAVRLREAVNDLTLLACSDDPKRGEKATRIARCVLGGGGGCAPGCRADSGSGLHKSECVQGS